MHRFYLPPAQCSGDVIELTDREAHHASQVLRLRSGENVTVLDGAGHVLDCRVADVTKRAVRLQVVRREFRPRPGFQVTLFQAIPKGKVMDVIVQKATELGAARIVPLITERVVSQFDDDSAEHKIEKWRAVAIESIKQCGSPWLPEIASPAPLKQILAARHDLDLQLVGSLHGSPQHARECFRGFEAAHKRRPERIAVWVGPEGDFTAAEIAAICAAGVKPVTLGPLVLRADTAAIYSLSIVNHEMLAE